MFIDVPQKLRYSENKILYVADGQFRAEEVWDESSIVFGEKTAYSNDFAASRRLGIRPLRTS